MSLHTCPTCGGRRRKKIETPVEGALTPTERSPFCLLQEELRDDPWRLLVACVLLSRSHSTSVRKVLGGDTGFFARWPTAMRLVQATEAEVAQVVSYLGMQNRRAETLLAMSQGWLELLQSDRRPPAHVVAELPGVGAYVLDSYRIWVEPGRLIHPLASDDKMLKSYQSWASAYVVKKAEESP